MGEVGSVIKALSCTDCAKYVCNSASCHSQCCVDEDGCNCEIKTEPTQIETIEGDVEIEMDSGCNDLCCNCLLRAHKSAELL